MPGSVKSEVKVLSRHSSVYGLSTILNRIVAFLMLPLYTHYLSPADYGILDLLALTAAYIGMTMQLGITAAMSRFYFDSDDQKDRNLVVSTTFYGFGVGTSAILLLIILGSGFLSRLVFQARGYSDLMVLALIGLALEMYIKVGFAYLRVRQRSTILLIISLIRLVIQLSLNVILLVVFSMGVRAMLWSNIAVGSMLVAFFVPYILRETGFGFSFDRLKAMLRFGLPLVPSDILGYIVNTSDRYFLNGLHNLTLTGLYSMGYRFGILINRFVVNPFAQIWMPRRFEKAREEGNEEIYGRIFTYFCLATSFVGLAISVLSKEAIQIITDRAFWDAYLVVPLITLSYIVESFKLHFGIGILIKKKTKYIMFINIIAAAVNLVLNYFLINKYHIWGAAWATLLTFLLKSVLHLYFSRRLTKVYVEKGRLIQMFITVAVLYWMLIQVDMGNIYVDLSLKAAGCLAYPLILIAVRFFTQEEIKEGKRLIRSGLRRIIPGLNKS